MFSKLIKIINGDRTLERQLMFAKAMLSAIVDPQSLPYQFQIDKRKVDVFMKQVDIEAFEEDGYYKIKMELRQNDSNEIVNASRTFAKEDIERDNTRGNQKREVQEHKSCIRWNKVSV